MDKWYVDQVITNGHGEKLVSRVRRMLNENAQEHKRVDYRKVLIRNGVKPENIERMLDRKHEPAPKAKPTKHVNPDREARIALKKRMKRRR